MNDDSHALRFVREALTRAGYAVQVTAEPSEIAAIVRSKEPRVVLLDLMLPGTGSIDLMTEITELSDLPAIYISGYGRDETIARAFEAGSADYIVKPFSPTELTARVRAALRVLTESFLLAGLVIGYERRRATVNGRAVTLTATEYEIIRVLAINAGRVLTLETLPRQVEDAEREPTAARVRTFDKQLRAKLGNDAAGPA